MLDITTIKNGDVYQNDKGEIWVVEAFWNEPTVKMKCVHPSQVYGGVPFTATGGVSDFMVGRFEKIASANTPGYPEI